MKTILIPKEKLNALLNHIIESALKSYVKEKK
jgi:hypothetical protein